MLIYLATYIAFALIAAFKLWKPAGGYVLAFMIFAFLTIFIGYRYQIGVDWVTYELIFLDASRSTLFDALGQGDSAYSLINWLVGQAGGQVWHVNLICAGIFSAGLILFCQILPRPGLALVVAVPTLIVITAMGYTRQAAAVGCIMLACRAFHGSISWRWLGWLCLGLLFHKSTLLIFPPFVLAASRNRWVSISVGGGIIIAALILVVARGLGDTLALYLEGDIDSSGTLPRIAIGLVAGLAFFLIKERKEIFEDRYALFRNMAMMMIIMLPLYFIIPSRTIMDRIGILLVPFQSMSYAGLAASIGRRNPIYEIPATVIIIVLYAILFLVWLLYATFANYWIPYINVWQVRWA
ncbi:EpsG family protein [Sphingomonas floccifaciens]|uniref:EpsG family protein n=1 Tax=Sphingomonas floccifaciens TaxID=1844115 RepID=A0ABW4NGJ4_9SPHN